MRLRTTSLLAILVALLHRSVVAGIVSTSGAVAVISPPANIQTGVLESDTVVSVFAERISHTLSANVGVDITIPGAYVPPVMDPSTFLTPDVLLAGAAVDSYFVHLDPVTNTSLEGSLSFDRDILGLIMTDATLAASHAELGFPGTTYGTQGQLEIGQESITLSADRRTVSFILNVLPNRDTMRIVTSAVPEPSTALLLFAGVATWLATLRRRR
jgi:hypothetical protein